jgi:phosphoserine phosphatase RsbU/P
MKDYLMDAPCGFVGFRDDAKIEFINATLAGWVEFAREDLIGKSMETIFPVATKIFYNTHLFPMVKLHGKAEEIYITLISKTKSSIPVLANLERRAEPDGSYITHCVFLPVFQRKKYEDEILHAKREAEKALKDNRHLQELKESLEWQTLELDRQYQKLRVFNENLLQFSKIISHDVQEPIRKIKLFTNAISTDESTRLSSRSEVAMEKVIASTDRLKLLTDGLKHYITVDSDVNYSRIDLEKVVAEAKEKAITHRNFYDFNFSYDSLPIIEGYKVQLELMFFHLFDNAIQFRHPDRRLSIVLRTIHLEQNLYRNSREKYRFAQHVRLHFSDNGIGFDEQYKEYVVGLLKKLSPDSDGLGIGLSLVNKIADNHAGDFDVESIPGKGTNAIITLPTKRVPDNDASDLHKHPAAT